METKKGGVGMKEKARLSPAVSEAEAIIDEALDARKPPIPERTVSGKEAILEVLSRAADETDFLARLAEDPSEALKEYYTLTQEEKAALASGDIKKIEGWVGKLDKRLATWLWCRLSQEKW
jgi:hypothetical protein